MSIQVTEKACSHCRRVLPASAFSKRTRAKTGLQSRCRECTSLTHQDYWKRHYEKNRERILRQQRDYYRSAPVEVRTRKKFKNRLAFYGLAEEELKALRARAAGLCEICRRRPYAQIDHDHKTQDVRGLLCANCNRLLGFACDDPEVLFAAIKYLKSAARRRRRRSGQPEAA